MSVAKIDKEYEGVRLDKYLRKHLPETTLGNIYKIIRNGMVRVNGKRSKEDYRLCLGDEVLIKINIELKKAETEYVYISTQEKEMIKKGIVFENEGLVVFNKPRGLVVHKGTGHEYGLVDMLMTYYKNEDIALVNRIDRETSGLVVASKTKQAARKLTEEIRERLIEKYYYVVVEGVVEKENFILKNTLLKDDVSVKTDEEGKYCEAEFKVVKRGENMTLLEAKLITGRTHQLRVQLSEIGHPITGDEKYGKKAKEGMQLHSHRIVIKSMEIDIDLPVPEWFSIKN